MTTYCWGATNFGACPSDNRQSTAVMALRRDPVLVSTSTPTNTSSSSRLDEFYKQIQAVTPDATLSPRTFRNNVYFCRSKMNFIFFSV